MRTFHGSPEDLRFWKAQLLRSGRIPRRKQNSKVRQSEQFSGFVRKANAYRILQVWTVPNRSSRFWFSRLLPYSKITIDSMTLRTQTSVSFGPRKVLGCLLNTSRDSTESEKFRTKKPLPGVHVEVSQPSGNPVGELVGPAAARRKSQS